MAGLDAFAEQLRAQIDHAGAPATERAIVSFLALGIQATANLAPGEIIFERPEGNGRIDLWVAPLDLAIEVKFHRPIHKGKPRPYAQLLGHMLADFHKLASVSAANKLAVLVTDTGDVKNLQQSPDGFLPLSPGGQTRIASEDVARLPKQAAAGAMAGGAWQSLSAELVWQAPCEPWHLFAWQVIPSS